MFRGRDEKKKPRRSEGSCLAVTREGGAIYRREMPKDGEGSPPRTEEEDPKPLIKVSVQRKKWGKRAPKGGKVMQGEFGNAKKK